MTTIEQSEAIALAEEHYYIFPMHRARQLPDAILCTCGKDGCSGKHPMVPFSSWATTNKEQIRSFWERHPQAGIGIHLGKSYQWCLDIDGNEGKSELKNIIDKYGELPETRHVISGSGKGEHYYFAGWVDKINSGSLSDNIHIKGNVGNAYVCAPPTQHVSGNRYDYVNRIEAVDAPQWLIDLAHKKSNNGGYSSKLTKEEIIKRQTREVSLVKLLNQEQYNLLHKEGDCLIGTHPIHGSKNGRNFCIDLNTNRWFCNRDTHKSSGGLLELAAMLTGLCKCEHFSRTDEIQINPISGKNFERSIAATLALGITKDELRKHLNLVDVNKCQV